MKMNICRLGIVGVAATQLLAGCVTTPEQAEQFSEIKIVSGTPVHITVSATPGPRQTTAIAMPAPTPPEANLPTGKPQRLTGLEPAVRRFVTTKASAFASLSDGPLAPAEIKLLFSGLQVTTHDGIPERHRFRDNGQVDGVVESGRERGISSGTVEEDSGTWSVSKKSRLCLDWIDWYSGDRTCYSVSKRGNRIVLSGGPYPFHYEIQN